MHGCCPAPAADQVAVDLWNARGKDVGASSQLGCPATAVVPRVSGSGKPPMDSQKGIAGAKPPATDPLTPHLPSLCRRMSENVAKVQKFHCLGFVYK